MGSNRDVFLALVDLGLEKQSKVVWQRLSPLVRAGVGCGAINVSCVPWDDIGDGDIAVVLVQ